MSLGRTSFKLVSHKISNFISFNSLPFISRLSQLCRNFVGHLSSFIGALLLYNPKMYSPSQQNKLNGKTITSKSSLLNSRQISGEISFS